MKTILHRIGKNPAIVFFIIASFVGLRFLDCLNRQISIGNRNDNDSRFIAASVQAFFKENHICQVFTHSYTLQESGHIESPHAILLKNTSDMCFGH